MQTHASSGWFTSLGKRADTPPRKTVVATALQPFSGRLGARLALTEALVAQAKAVAPHHKLDLVVLPEGAIASGREGAGKERSVTLADETMNRLAATARAHRTYLVVPIILHEEDTRIANAAVLFDRAGNIVGIYRKVHPVAALGETDLEGGIEPGRAFPVFDCDFGRLGIQICWDMSYEDGWAELARQGAELVAVPSASPQTVRPAMYALRGPYYVITSTPRNNATIFSPIGLPVAQRTEAGMLVQELDLAYAILHWSPTLDSGNALVRQYGNRVGFVYSDREDTGVFWSNDPRLSIATMVREAGLERMDEQIQRCNSRRRPA